MNTDLADIAGFDELKEYKGKWRNLYFFKSRPPRFLLPACFFDKENEANQASEDYIIFLHQEARMHAKNGRIAIIHLDETGGEEILCTDVSHAIPMPTGDA